MESMVFKCHSSETSWPLDTISSFLILKAAVPPSTFPCPIQETFFLTAPDTARGVLPLEIETIRK